MDHSDETPPRVEDVARDRFSGRVASGVRWSLLEQAGQQLGRLVVVAVLTNLLSPRDFGLVAMAYVFTQLAALLSDLGLAPALVQRRELTGQHVAAAFAGSLLFGAAMTALLVVLARPIASFFDEPRLASVLAALSVVFLLNGARETPRYLFRRSLDFGPIVTASLVGTGLSGTVAIALAAAGAGVWSLVVYTLLEVTIGAALLTALALRRRVWRPSVAFTRAAFRDLFGFGAYVSGVRLLYYGQSNLDNLLVGKFIGAAALGFYGLAYRIMLFPLQRVADVLGTVAFPAFAAVQHDVVRLQRGFSRAVETIAVACFPLSIGTLVVAPLAVPVLFGDQWAPAVPALQVLALNGPRMAVNRLNGALYQATGRPSWELVVTSISFVLYGAGFAAGLPHGIIGVAAGYTVAGHLVLPVAQGLVGRALQASPWQLLAGLRPVIAATAAMAVAAEATRRVLGDSVGDGLALAMVVAVGAGAYVATLRVTGWYLVTRLWADLRRR